jgi:hypothetical protein
MRHVSEERLGEHIPAATVTYAPGETGCCLCGPLRGIIKRELGQPSPLRVEFCMGGCEDRT